MGESGNNSPAAVEELATPIRQERDVERATGSQGSDSFDGSGGCGREGESSIDDGCEFSHG